MLDACGRAARVHPTASEYVQAAASLSNGSVGATCTCGFLSHQLESWMVVSPLQPANYNVLPLPTDGEPHHLRAAYHVKGEVGTAAAHPFESALRKVSSSDWRNGLRLIRFDLAGQFSGEGRFDEAHAHVKCLKSCAANHPYILVLAMGPQEWYKRGRLEDARFEH